MEQLVAQGQHRNEGAVTDRGVNYWESADRTELVACHRQKSLAYASENFSWERVADDHRPFGEALEPGHLDVVGLEHLDHRGAHDPHHTGHLPAHAVGRRPLGSGRLIWHGLCIATARRCEVAMDPVIPIADLQPIYSVAEVGRALDLDEAIALLDRLTQGDAVDGG